MRILAIETSCDETGAAVVQDGRKIISNVVASSGNLHVKTGGIIPEVAAREQVRCIIPVIEEALLHRTNNIKHKTNKKLLYVPCSLFNDIDAIAVTVGPGLIGSLLVGVEAAKTLSYISGKPIVPVNHVLAHIYANFLQINQSPKTKDQRPISFPAIALVVSGGHTELYLMKSINSLKWLGGTLDDAAGEAFDKTARILGLGYPGGPAISAAAEKFQIPNSKFEIKLPRPMMDQDNLSFSFSGLKTAVMKEVNRLKSIKQLNNLTIQQLAHEIQEAITDVLVHKTILAAQRYNVKSILLGGGVAANQRLKQKFSSQITNYQLPIILRVPPPSLCTDNASYIASYAYFNFHPVPWQKIQARPDLDVEV